ncbi:hypothetical protein C8J57DRAFT_1365834 [Mycena rebaudengoi]|nr:hypothetical protein C8J57DRAFT_1365834 [Mycena rebaudengoi]
MAVTSLQIAAYLRVSAYAIAFFDYLQTLPAEYRLYAKQKGPLDMSLACVLFILVRYIGLISIIIGNTGFFYHGFTHENCLRYFWLTPVFKLILYMVSQTILAIRTYAVSRKSPMVLRVLVALFVITAVPEFISTFWKRVPFNNNGNCTSGNPPGIKIASLYYAGGLVFDVVTMAMTSVYLWKFSNTSRTSLSQLAKMMLQDGIIYFVALTAMNVVNLIFFQSADTVLQPSASTLGFAATMIFSSRFVLNLSEHVRETSELSGSRPPQNNVSSHGFRGGHSQQEPELVVKVVKNVITMDDMSMSRDDDSESRMKGGVQWANGGNVA